MNLGANFISKLSKLFGEVGRVDRRVFVKTNFCSSFFLWNPLLFDTHHQIGSYWVNQCVLALSLFRIQDTGYNVYCVWYVIDWQKIYWNNIWSKKFYYFSFQFLQELLRRKPDQPSISWWNKTLTDSTFHTENRNLEK